MKLLFHFGRKPVEEPLLLPMYPESPQEQNVTEGGEFLDDAIRSTEQPLAALRTEESIAPGSPANLL